MFCSTQYMRWALCLAFCFALAISSFGCSHQPPPFLGKWVKGASGSEAQIDFNADGTGKIYANMLMATLDSPFTWRQEGQKIVAKLDVYKPGKTPSNVSPEDATLTLTWTWLVSDQSLTLTDDKGNAEVYQREEPASHK